MKIGLIADTHMPGSIDELWPHASEFFNGVDLILHAGDLHTLDIVDHLSDIAPTYVSRGNGDLDISDDRLRDNWLLDLGGVRVGLIHHFPSPARKSPEKLDRHISRHFDETPDIVVYGHTHLEDIRAVNGRLYINPGSPTLPRNQSLRPGTLGLMEISAEHVDVQILQLTENRVTHHEFITPFRQRHAGNQEPSD